MRRLATVVLAAFLGLAVQSAGQAAKAEALLGSFRVTENAGIYTVSGWACSKGTSAEIMVDVYLDGARPIGSLGGRREANLPSVPAVVSRCGSAGTNFDFRIPITAETVFRHGGHPIYVYGQSPTGGTALLLPNSGIIEVPAYSPAPAAPSTCNLTQGDPEHCLANIGNYDRIAFAGDVTCISAATCCPNGQALLNLYRLSNKVIEGNGHILTRSAGQKRCPAISIFNASNILVDNLSINDDAAVPPCKIQDFGSGGVCSATSGATISVFTDTNVKLHAVSVYSGKGYVVRVLQTNGFAFDASSISESGVEGLSVGSASTNVLVTDSVISGSQTNGLEIQSTAGGAPDEPTLIANNILNRNYYNGLYTVSGTVVAGGQVLLGSVTNVRVANNIIADGYCSNCTASAGTAGAGISAIELGALGVNGQGVSGLKLDHNYFYNGNMSVSAISQDLGSKLTDVTITDNDVVGFGSVSNINAPQSVVRNNPVINAVPSLSLNGGSYTNIFREYALQAHWESKQPGELSAYLGCNLTRTCTVQLQEIFELSLQPVITASPRPLFRCFTTQQVPGHYIKPIAPSRDDFLSTDQLCGGTGTLHSIAGFSYAANTPSAQPFYLCHTTYPDGRVDHFVSYDSACEGKTKEGVLGYAIRPAG